MSQSVYLGENKIQELLTLLNQYSARNIFLVTGKNSYQSSGVKDILENLLKGFKVTRFFDFENNPEITDVKKGIDIFKGRQYDIVIAVGGGSVIDMSKLINILSQQEGKCEDLILGESEIFKKNKPLICIPTTAGSGSEATHFAAVYINNKKYSLTHSFILPDIAIVDPRFTYNLPKYITASTGLDALSQAIESYWNVNSTTESKLYSKKAIKTIIKYLPEAVKNNSKKARFKMSMAAYYAGKAINITKTTAPHAVSYPFTSFFNIAHGHAVALTLPYFLEFNYYVNENDTIDKRGSQYVRNTLIEVCTLMGFDSIEKAKKGLIDFIEELGLTLNLKTLGIRNNNDINLILDNVDAERMQNNPRLVKIENIRDFITHR